MKRLNAAAILILLSMAAITMTGLLGSRTDAWGLSTHMAIVSEASDRITNSTWNEAFDFYAPELLAGATTPDQVFQDWVNHVYHPDTGYGGAPLAASKWFNMSLDNSSLGNWEDAFFALGVASHYLIDPTNPAHTGALWDGHTGYERDINENLDLLVIGGSSETVVTNVSQLVVDGATLAYPYYDDVVAAYANADSRAITTNATIRAFTEECLWRAVNSCLALFYSFTQYSEAPDTTITYDYVALVDYAHSNDYASGNQLTSINQTLTRNHFEMRTQTSAFTAESLADVDLLIITCALNAYSPSEIEAIQDWSVAGNKSILIVGRGDFSTSTDIARPNSILTAIGSHILLNDDNVYMQGTYQLWYNDLTNIPAPGQTLGLTLSVLSITMFSPTSLYFTDERPALPVLFADPSGYQTDQTSPGIQFVYDDTIDGVNGDQIVLAAVEQVGSLRVLVAGTTFFSDFDYGKSQFDNVQFLENFLDWASGNRSVDVVPSVDEIGPRISGITLSPAAPIEGQTVAVSAAISDISGVTGAMLTVWGAPEALVIPMTETSPGTYKANVSYVDEASMQFRIVANDTEDNVAVRERYTITWTPEATTTTTTTTTSTTTTTTTTTATTNATTTTTTTVPWSGFQLYIIVAIVGLLVAAIVVKIVTRK